MDNAGSNTELDKVFAILDDIDTAMLTTRRTDGHLVSRAMATQARAAGADIWFVTTAGSGKLGEINADPHVNLTYFNESSREWISISGMAMVSRDRATIHTLYRPDWAIWFPQDGEDPRHGTADDPRMVLIAITIVAATFLEVNKPKPVVLYEIVKGWVTGSEPELGEMHHVEKETGDRQGSGDRGQGSGDAVFGHGDRERAIADRQRELTARDHQRERAAAVD